MSARSSSRAASREARSVAPADASGSDMGMGTAASAQYRNSAVCGLRSAVSGPVCDAEDWRPKTVAGRVRLIGEPETERVDHLRVFVAVEERRGVAELLELGAAVDVPRAEAGRAAQRNR